MENLTGEDVLGEMTPAELFALEEMTFEATGHRKVPRHKQGLQEISLELRRLRPEIAVAAVAEMSGQVSGLRMRLQELNGVLNGGDPNNDLVDELPAPCIILVNAATLGLDEKASAEFIGAVTAAGQSIVELVIEAALFPEKVDEIFKSVEQKLTFIRRAHLREVKSYGDGATVTVD